MELPRGERRARGPRISEGSGLTTLPDSIWSLILSKLPLDDRLQCAAACSLFAEVTRASLTGVAIDLRHKSRAVNGRLLSSPGLTDLAVVSPAAAAALGSPAAAASSAGLWDPEEHRLWQQGGRRLRPAAAMPHLRRAACALTEGGKHGGVPAPRRRALSLALAAPEMDASAAELHCMLQAADAEGLFASVSVPQGLLRLDGQLADRLTRCNTRAATLPPALQAPASYPRLQCLALKLLPEDDSELCLGCINTRTLPALRCLALLAPAGAGAAADLRPLRHGALTRLDLHGVQLPAGFPSLLHLTGLRELRVRYDEEDAAEVPPLNLQGDLAALAALKQLESLHLDCLGGGEGLAALTQLTRLALAPQGAARIRLRGLPRLRRLCVDLSSASCGRDLLSASASTVHVPAGAHGLAALTELELRCLVWRHWKDDGSQAGSADSNPGGSEASSVAEGSDAGSDTGSDAGSDGGGDQEDAEESHAPYWAPDADVEPAAVDAAALGAAGGQQGSPPGMLHASWGFLQQQAVAALQAHPLACLEQRYIARLLDVLPTLAAIKLTDYMGLVDSHALLAAEPSCPHAKAGGAGAAAPPAGGGGRDAGPGASRAGTPGLLPPRGGGGAACSLVGWRRQVAEAPVPGGISQWDLCYTSRAGGAAD